MLQANIGIHRRYRSLGLVIACVVLTMLCGLPFQERPVFFPAVAQSLAAAPADEPAPRSLWPHERSDLEPDADIYFGRLENGFRFVLMRNDNPKDRVSMHLDIQAGSAQESDSQQGLAHFLEHMLFCGSENFPPGELVKYFQSIGMQFGPDANAHTGFYETVYDILLPRGDAADLKQGLLVMKDYAQGALLLPSEIDRERKVVLAEKRTRDSASYRTFEATIQFELPEARISRRLPIGKEDVIAQATRADFKAYYDTWYRPDRMILVAAGDLDIETAASLIREYFADMAPRVNTVPAIPFGEIRHSGVKAFHHYEKESGNATVTLEVLTREDRPRDTLATRKQMAAKQLADQIVQNRLDASIGRNGVPGTSAAVGSGIYLNQIRYAMITAEGDAKEWEALLAYLEQTLRKALTFGFSEAELERVKKDFLAGLDQAVKKKGTRESKNLAGTIIRELSANRVLLSPENEKALLAPYIESLSPGEVHQALQDSWKPGHRLILLTGNADPSAEGKQATDVMLQVYDASREKAVAPPAAKQNAVFPYLEPLQGESAEVHRTDHPDIGVLQIDYANGFRLNLKQTDFKDDEILASLTLGHGRYDEPEKLSGLAELSAAVINESGLGALSKDEIEAALSGKQTHLSFKVNESSFSFNGDTVPEELELLFQLLYAHIQDPGFRRDAFQLVMNQFKNHYEELAHTLEGGMTLKGERFLAGGDGRFGLPSDSEFMRLSLDDVRQWIEPAFSRAPLELSIVGDFDPNEAAKLAARYFGTLPPRTALPESPRDNPVFPSGQSLQITVDSEIPSGLVYVSYPTEDIWDIQRTRRLSVLADVFTERMRVRIREKLGEAYSPVAYNRAFRAYQGYGIFHVIVEVNPAAARRVIDEIRQIAADIARDGVTADEIRRSLKPTLNSIKDMRQRNPYWLQTVLRESNRHPQQLEWSRHMLDDYASITAQDVDRMAGAYLKNERAAVVLASPSAVKTGD